MKCILVINNNAVDIFADTSFFFTIYDFYFCLIPQNKSEDQR